jgi:cytoskeletal protein CcmA (bactofilin family)
MEFVNKLKKTGSSELFLPVNSKFDGDISMEGHAQISGAVNGNIKADHGNLICGAESVIKGNLEGVDIAIFGVVEGNVKSHGQLSLFGGAKLTGSVNAAAFVVEKNASYDGHVTIAPPTSSDNINDSDK